SILTQPEGWVLHGIGMGFGGTFDVSILTQPEGWVLLAHGDKSAIILVAFQSSPNPKVGCYILPYTAKYMVWCFNPHPTRRLGATVRYDTSAVGYSCFNPHPTRRLGATHVEEGVGHLRKVSILTQPEGWVLRRVLVDILHALAVLILTQPEGWVLHALTLLI